MKKAALESTNAYEATLVYYDDIMDGEIETTFVTFATSLRKAIKKIEDEFSDKSMYDFEIIYAAKLENTPIF